MNKDEKAFAFYEDPQHREPTGQGRRIRPALTRYVPIRFTGDVITKVHVLADRDGKTVSSWIRDVVNAEVERRLPLVKNSTSPSATSKLRLVRTEDKKTSTVIPENQRAQATI